MISVVQVEGRGNVIEMLLRAVVQRCRVNKGESQTGDVDDDDDGGNG